MMLGSLALRPSQTLGTTRSSRTSVTASAAREVFSVASMTLRYPNLPTQRIRIVGANRKVAGIRCPPKAGRTFQVLGTRNTFQTSSKARNRLRLFLAFFTALTTSQFSLCERLVRLLLSTYLLSLIVI